MERSERTVHGVWWVVVLVAFGIAAAWTACGGSGGGDEGCNPPCGINEVCIDGICQASDAGTDALPDTVDVPDEATDASEFAPVDGTEEGAVDDAAEAVEDARSDIDAAGFNIGEACAGDTDCVGPGDPTCLSTIPLPVIGAITFTGGYCSGTCDGADVGSCGPDALCVDLSFVGWVGCLQACTPGVPGQCREAEGYTCFDPASIPYLPIPGAVCVPSFM
jgi:hypothetical protein